MNTRIYLVPVLVVSLLLSLGCSFSRTTTTGRTAIEQALLTESAAGALRLTDFPDLEQRTFNIQAEGFDPVERHFIVSTLTEQLLKAEGRLELQEEPAELTVEPRAALSNLDGSEFLIGIPSLQVPIPASGTVNTPELALLSKTSQRARAQFSVFAVDTDSGELVFARDTPPVLEDYQRWKILIFFGFRTTTLDNGYAGDSVHDSDPYAWDREELKELED